MNTPSAIDLQGNGFNNDWRVKQRKPFGDLKLGADWSHRWDVDGAQVGLVGALNYTNETRAYTDMINNLFGVYDQANDRSNYLRHSVDNQYNNNVRLGAMLNLALLTSGGNDRIELRQEFREVSPSVYYDFDLASHVQGNVDLKPCYVHNLDLRYEFYPSRGEQITLAGFYKRFDNPIEWACTVWPLYP